MNKAALLVGVVAMSLVAACRGQESAEPPIHLNPNMDSQPRYDPQAESKFFGNRGTMRPLEDGVVARGHLEENDAFERGREGDKYVAKIPVPVNEALLARGQERYNIYCTPCHDKTGSGNGLVVKHGYPAARNLLDDYTRKMPDGQVYSAMAYGIRNMPSYGPQVPTADRWAIVAYVRALEFAENAQINDVPQDKRASLAVETNP